MGRCGFLQDRFSDKTFCAVGSKFAAEVFILSTLENSHQISRSRSLVRELSLWRNCNSQNKWNPLIKNNYSLYMFKSSLFLISRTHTEFFNRAEHILYVLIFHRVKWCCIFIFTYAKRWVLIYNNNNSNN